MNIPGGGNSIGSANDDGNHHTSTATCGPRGDGEYGAFHPCYVWDVSYGNYQLAYGCEASKTMPVYQQTETFCYWAKNGEVSVCFGWQPSSVSGLTGSLRGMQPHV